MPLLFQRRIGGVNRSIPPDTIREWICRAVPVTSTADGSLSNSAGQPLRFTPHDFRRIFITDAVLHGMPPHIAQLVAGHRDINTTMGYKAVYPEEAINGHRAFIARRRALRPAEEYRTPTDEEWQEFLGHFEHRKVSLGTCGRSYATACIHEHSCLTELILMTAPGRVGSQCSPKVTGKNLGLPGSSAWRRRPRRLFSRGWSGIARRSCGAGRDFRRGR